MLKIPPAMGQATETKEVDRRPTGWEVTERVARICATLALPIVIAVIGWRWQDSMSQRATSQDYVALAITMLRDSSMAPELRGWAVDLLSMNSPVQFDATVKEKLRSGNLSLPGGTVLTPGDLAIVGLKANQAEDLKIDEFSFVSFKAIAAGTVLTVRMETNGDTIRMSGALSGRFLRVDSTGRLEYIQE